MAKILVAIVVVSVWLELDNDFNIVAYLPIVGIVVYSRKHVKMWSMHHFEKTSQWH